jgi:NADH dehydrogenase FAD-containing subunit
MGSNNSTPNVNPGVTKKIVVVGFSYAGQGIIDAICKADTTKSCSITVIDKSDHFEHIPNQFESFTDKDVFKNQNTISFDKMANSFNHFLGGRFEFKQARLTEVMHAENKVSICDIDGKTETLDYDVLCVCTGANYVGPWRAAADKCDTLADRNDEFNEVREAIGSA